jgi:peptidoglycan/LPS O-acetylase OafA/YrhL
MNRKAIYGILGLLFVVAAVVMYAVGNKSSHLSELKDFWWYPLPLAALCLLGAATPNKKSK